jgi:hypothetical protein
MNTERAIAGAMLLAYLALLSVGYLAPKLFGSMLGPDTARRKAVIVGNVELIQ